MSEKRIDEDWKSRAHQEKGQEPPPPEVPPGPPDFLEFVTGLATQAWVHLGAIPNPFTGKTEPEPDQARYMIDVIEMLSEKTRGNLKPEESKHLEALLAELHFAFVTHSPPTP